MLMHIGTAFIDNKVSFQAANQEHVNYYQCTALGSNLAREDIVSLYRQIRELNMQLDNEWQHYNHLEENYNNVKHNVKHLQGECKNTRIECDTFKLEADLLHEEVSWLRIHNQELENQVPISHSTVHPGKRKQTDNGPSTISTVASSQHEDMEMVNYSKVNSVDIVVEPVVPEDLPDGGYCMYKGFILYGSNAADACQNTAMNVPLAHGGGIRHIKKPGDLTTVFETAINTPENEQNDLHCMIISNFFRPRFVDGAQSKKVNKGKGWEVLPDPEPELPLHDMMGSLPTAPMGAKSRKKNKSSAPLTQALLSGVTTTQAKEQMKNPTLSDLPEYWAQYYYEHPNNSVGGIRSSSTVASEVTVLHYPNTETQNAILGSVAVFYASQGITVAMAEDAATFAIEWLAGFHSMDSLLTNKAHAVWDRVGSVVSMGIVLAGFDENAWLLTGLLVHLSAPVPRTVFFPVLPSSSSSGLPYGSPLNAIALSNNLAGAPSSSLSSALPPQTDQSRAIAMVDAGSSTK
ncbi:hypothetical protein BT96DRAFT_938915 [Gymnopus androsaceus JB14]|uniref:Uncharacterized protein n=1 Tax=Gymnopus androsaceus JB14 TaxID=1447944 RepID=A0A6A4HMH9_9AGAR|nr:hypothetical protein BT96DRAFT_938915 [Gymnopus androsaceus JB14]